MTKADEVYSSGKPVVPPPTSAPVVTKPATIVAPGATSRLVHPDEDISLVGKLVISRVVIRGLQLLETSPVCFQIVQIICKS